MPPSVIETSQALLNRITTGIEASRHSPMAAASESDHTFELLRQLLDTLCQPLRWRFALVLASNPAADVESVRVTGGGAIRSTQTEELIGLLEAGAEALDARDAGEESSDCPQCGYDLLECRCDVECNCGDCSDEDEAQNGTSSS